MAQSLKLISWNVNGLRAALRKGFLEYINQEDPDIVCLQETKAQQGQAEFDLPQYTEYWNSAVRKGYSGTAIFTKTIPINVTYGLNTAVSLADKYGDAATEGRVITAEFDKFFVVTVYTPNSKGDLSRLDFREKVWDVMFLQHLQELQQRKPVIFCGDLNVAHMEIDLARPDQNHFNHGFTEQERQGFTNIINTGFVDTFRIFNQEPGNYSWWAPFGGAKSRNIGWRIDYFGVSQSLKNNVKQAFIHPHINASDHCPIGIVVEI